MRKKLRSIMSCQSWYSNKKLARMPTNEDLINADACEIKSQIESHKKKCDSALRNFIRKRKKLHDNEQLLDRVKQITEIVNDIAISHNFGIDYQEGAEFYTVAAVCHEIKRAARVYRNQHNKITWGIQLFDHKAGWPYRGDKFIGAQYSNLPQCKTLAIEWVTKGTYDVSNLETNTEQRI